MSVGLTAGQRATFRRAYRDAYAESDSYATLDGVYTKYEELYGVPRDVLVEIATEDHRRNRAQYQALHAARDLEKQRERKARRKRAHNARQERERKVREARKVNCQPDTKQPQEANPQPITKQAQKARRRAAFKAKERAELEAARQRAVTNPSYYTQATCCPVCLRDLGAERIPRHDDTRWHVCNGSGRFGVTQHTAEQLRRTKGRSEFERSSSVRTVSGGLPGLGKGHR